MKDRLRQIINYTALKQTEFADKLHVQRSNISHFLSGRNKPRLDFIEKLKDAYPEISLEWFIMGTGDMFVNKNNPLDKEPSTPSKPTSKPSDNKTDKDNTDVTSENIPEKETQKGKNEGIESTQVISSSEDGSANEIIIIYSDKTFDTYKKRS